MKRLRTVNRRGRRAEQREADKRAAMRRDEHRIRARSQSTAKG